MSKRIFKVVHGSAWDEAQRSGVFQGAEIDRRDGYIHFSTAEQLPETLAKHFAGQTDLLLVACDADDLGTDLKWEPSRGGDLFPHLYASLPVALARETWELALDESGQPILPAVERND